MAGKLRDDEIKWILTVDAKGAQAEVQNLVSSSVQLTDANKKLKIEMKEANAQIKEAEKEIRRLEKANKADSDQYRQLQATIASAQSDVADYTRQINENTASINFNDRSIQQTIQSMKLEEMTMNQLRNRASNLQGQLNNTAEATSPEAYRQLQEELEAVTERMGVVGNANKGLMSQLSSIPGPAGGVINSIKGIGTALKALIANPVGVVIMVIVGAFTALKKIIESNEESIYALNRILAPLKLLFDAILNILQKLVLSFLNFVETAISGIAKLLSKIPGLNKLMAETNEKAKEAIQLEKDKQSLRVREREQLVKTAKKELEISKLRNDAKRKDLFSDEERLKKLNEAIKFEKEISEEKVYQAKESLRLLELEAARTKNLGEVNDKLAQARANVYNVEKEHYDKTRRMESEISSTTLEMQRERVDAAKKANEERLKQIENTLNLEINALKKSRNQGLIDEKKYNEEVERLTIESINKKKEIKGQEKSQLIQYEAQILDAELKLQEKADKELVERLNKWKDERLQLLEISKNAQLEELQEREKDQAIYALRAKEIESQVAEARLLIIEQVGETIKNSEFKNIQNRVDAIKDSEKEIVSAESSTLKARADLQKQFAKTTADFEKQYNIKTWEQRKEDELRILSKQYESGLLAQETYQLALTAIDKKYEDEKLKVREQYAITSMSELYNAQMEALLEQHEKGLLSEEEYEKAKLQIKLKYAGEYAQKSAEFASMASDAASALQSAEIANTEAKYDAEIQAAGNNKEEVERLENEKAKKKLDIEKKYADVQFAVTAAEIVSNTALAIMQAYAQLGPIAGTVAAVLMGITGAAQLAVANAQRQKVKQMSLSGSGSSEASKTGQIKLKEGFAEGGSNTGDFTNGGYTGDGGRYEVAGWLPVHHGEYTVAVPEMKDPVAQDHVRALEKIRRKRTNKNPLPAGFADGGANMPSSGNSNPDDDVIIDGRIALQLLGVLNDLKDGNVKVNYGITEMEAKQKDKIDYESKFDLRS